MPLTDQLAALRTRRRMSLAAVGDLIGMAVPNLSAILRGRGDTKASTLVAVAAALDAEWVLVPKAHSPQVRRILECGEGDAVVSGPATAPPATRAIEMFSEKK
ncbi:MAG TPA: helix-turn-helix transcriptional regulator [Trinickia sp.]|nr:helix-turn-helix transcriptional regulator [Trinickia sp.]